MEVPNYNPLLQPRSFPFLPALCHYSIPTLPFGPRRRFYVLAQKIVSTVTGQLDFLIT